MFPGSQRRKGNQMMMPHEPRDDEHPKLNHSQQLFQRAANQSSALLVPIACLRLVTAKASAPSILPCFETLRKNAQQWGRRVMVITHCFFLLCKQTVDDLARTLLCEPKKGKKWKSLAKDWLSLDKFLPDRKKTRPNFRRTRAQ
jgi:hypothetical protein